VLSKRLMAEQKRSEGATDDSILPRFYGNDEWPSQVIHNHGFDPVDLHRRGVVGALRLDAATADLRADLRDHARLALQGPRIVDGQQDHPPGACVHDRRLSPSSA